MTKPKTEPQGPASGAPTSGDAGEHAPTQRMKKRGRPANASIPRLRAADELIAKSVDMLMLFGFPLRTPHNTVAGRGYIDEAIAAAAREVMGRTDHAGRALSGERVRQIYVAWLAANSRPTLWRRRWRDYPAAERASRMPLAARGLSLVEIAATILRSDGEWPTPDPEWMEAAPRSDLPFTAGAHTRWLMTPKLRLVKTG